MRYFIENFRPTWSEIVATATLAFIWLFIILVLA